MSYLDLVMPLIVEAYKTNEKIEYLKTKKAFFDEAKTITKEAHDLCGKLFGYLPISDTIDEILHPTGVSYNHALACQRAIDDGVDITISKDILKHIIETKYY